MQFSLPNKDSKRNVVKEYDSFLVWLFPKESVISLACFLCCIHELVIGAGRSHQNLHFKNCMLLSLTLITTNLFRYWSQVSSLWVTSELLLYFPRMFSWMLIISCNAISILLGKVVLITELHIVVVFPRTIYTNGGGDTTLVWCIIIFFHLLL